jgi:hypothetical protein
MSNAIQIFETDAFINASGITKGTRACSCCGKIKPYSAFKSPTHPKCKYCCDRKKVRQRKIIELQQTLTEMTTKQIVAATRGDRIDAPRISQLCATMIDLFRGLDGFCKLWHQEIMTCLEERPGSIGGLNQLQAIAKLIKDSTHSVDNVSPLASLSDEELHEQYECAVKIEALRLITESVQSSQLLESMPDMQADSEEEGNLDGCD